MVLAVKESSGRPTLREDFFQNECLFNSSQTLIQAIAKIAETAVVNFQLMSPITMNPLPDGVLTTGG